MQCRINIRIIVALNVINTYNNLLIYVPIQIVFKIIVFVMDARELNVFPDNSFTLVIDKGYTDTIFCSAEIYHSMNRLCSEIFRVLKPEGGVFAMVSYAPPPTRIPYLRCVPWAVDSCSLRK